MRKPCPATVRSSIRTQVRTLSADEYIRRLDRLLVLATVTTFVLAASFLAKTM